MNSLKNIKYSMLLFTVLLSTVVAFQGCKKENNASKETLTRSSERQEKKLTFIQHKIVDSAKYWWAHAPAEVSGDAIADLVFINNNASGGYLGYYKGQKEEGLWALHTIAETPPNGGLFAAGDLECADMDNDGDMDVIAVKHPGEWTDADAQAELFWYENPNWNPHAIGMVPDAVKDISITDFDNDGKKDIAILTFEEHTLSIFRQKEDDLWERVQYITHNMALHEGMDTGDIDGDGFRDISANGFVYFNPGVDLKKLWREENIDSIWNNQKGDWSRNGTKTFVKDIDKDGKSEIFISHSERANYPLKMYQYQDNGAWKSKTITDALSACHTLQVFDFDNDGNEDILAGINKARAMNLQIDHFEIVLFLSDKNYSHWTKKIIGDDGIYNGQVIDYDRDGDYDIFRYPNHESEAFFILKNQIKSSSIN